MEEGSVAGVLLVMGVLASVIACEPASVASEGERLRVSTTETGTVPTPTERRMHGVRWMDAEGAEVVGVAEVFGGPSYSDEGTWWSLDPRADDREEAFHPFPSLWLNRFTDPSCLDHVVQVAANILPNQAIEESVGQYWALEREHTEILADALYLIDEEDGACLPVGDGPHYAYQLSSFRPVFRPQLSWAVPVSPEYFY